MSERLIIVETASQLQELVKYMDSQEYITFDTETTGLDKDCKVIGISVCAEESKAYYVILQKWDVSTSQLLECEPNQSIIALLQSLIGKRLIAHNAIFDCRVIKDNFGIDLMPYVHTDTLVLGHLLDENRRNGLKELGESLLGSDARKEQLEMKASIKANGGVVTVDKYELYKADSHLIARYGAKDALLTLKLFYLFVEDLYAQNLQDFFYKDESMPLLRGPTYDLNTTGLRIDINKLSTLKGTLEAECLELKAFIHQEIAPHIADKYPGTSKVKTFNISAPQQLSWLLFERLGNLFGTLTDSGRDICKYLNLKPPYTNADKRVFIDAVKGQEGTNYSDGGVDPITKKLQRPKAIGAFWKYTSTDADVLEELATKYKWVAALQKYNKNNKLLSTYIEGIQERLRYSIIYPEFKQIGTTSGRYSCKNPNFQNLPRDDKRIKECVVSRPGKVFVGADYAQLEPRVFASVSQDPTLMSCFSSGQDFYSVVGAPIFGKTDCTMIKSDKESFAEKYPKLRNIAKAFALATPYGTSAFQQSQVLGLKKQECQDIIDKYFEAYPKVELMMLQSHEIAKKEGIVYNLYGRPRRIPEAKKINKIYGDTPHGELPYEARTLLNLGMNHRVQSSAASIVNRAAQALWNAFKDLGFDAKIVLQVHDEIVVECNESDSVIVSELLKHYMETTTKLPGVELIAEPKIGRSLAELK